MASSVTQYYTLLKNTTIEHSERLVILETCNQSDEETMAMGMTMTSTMTMTMNTLKDQPKRLMTFGTFDQSDEKT